MCSAPVRYRKLADRGTTKDQLLLASVYSFNVTHNGDRIVVSDFFQREFFLLLLYII